MGFSEFDDGCMFGMQHVDDALPHESVFGASE
jgi:hypothetical protein